jgi:hypothetical protein
LKIYIAINVGSKDLTKHTTRKAYEKLHHWSSKEVSLVTMLISMPTKSEEKYKYL